MAPLATEAIIKQLNSVLSIFFSLLTCFSPALLIFPFNICQWLYFLTCFCFKDIYYESEVIYKASGLKECFVKTGNLKKKYLKKAAYLGVGIRGRFIYFSVTIFEYLTLHLVNRTARSAVNRELLF